MAADGDERRRKMTQGVAIGVVAVFVVVTGISLAFGMSAVLAIAVGLLVGIFLGGGLGLLLGAALSSDDEEP